MEPVAFKFTLFNLNVDINPCYSFIVFYSRKRSIYSVFSSLFRLIGMAFISFYYDFLNFSLLKSSFTIKYSKQLLILAFPFYITALLSLVSNQFPIQFWRLILPMKKLLFLMLQIN